MCSRKSVLCTLQEVYSVHVAFSELRLTGRENATNKKNHLDGGQILWFLSRNCLEVYCRQFPGARFNFRNCFIDHLWTSGLATYHPVSCVVSILSNSNTTSVCSTRMLKTTEMRKMKLGVRVLLRSTFPNSCLAIPVHLAFQDRVYHSIALSLLVDFEQHSNLVAIVFAFRPKRSSLLSILVSLIKVGRVYLGPCFLVKSDCDLCLVVHAAPSERYQSVRCRRGISPKHLTSRCLVRIFRRSHRSAIYPKLTYRFCCLFSCLEAHLSPCDDAFSTVGVDACDLLKSSEMHESMSF